MKTNLTVTMVATTTANIRKSPVANTGLRDLVSQLTHSFTCRPHSHNIVFINEVPEYLQLDTDAGVFASVFNGLLDAVFAYTKDSCIKATAKIYGNVILLKLKDSNNPHIDSMETEMKKLKPIAEMMKGSLNVTIQNKTSTTVTFGFPNSPIHY